MPRQVFSFDPPERFVVGTVGQPGQREFYLQASGNGRVVSVALEKVQAAVLAERLAELLDEVRRRGGDIPSDAPPELEDVAPLDLPILEEFRVGQMALAWDNEVSLVVIEALAAVEGGEDETPLEVEDGEQDETDGPDILRVRMSAAQARSFVKRALRVVSAGRPPCALCGLPLDPEGHVCPRQNGHRH
jgi:uncharacterized repeat protein (TIGR03847 family)